jgi:hypothetical protein
VTVTFIYCDTYIYFLWHCHFLLWHWHLYIVQLTFIYCDIDIYLLWHWHLYIVQLTFIYCDIDIYLLLHWHLYIVQLTFIYCDIDIYLLLHWHLFIVLLTFIKMHWPSWYFQFDCKCKKIVGAPWSSIQGAPISNWIDRVRPALTEPWPLSNPPPP